MFFIFVDSSQQRKFLYGELFQNYGILARTLTYVHDEPGPEDRLVKGSSKVEIITTV